MERSKEKDGTKGPYNASADALLAPPRQLNIVESRQTRDDDSWKELLEEDSDFEAVGYWQDLFMDAECVAFPLPTSTDHCRLDSIADHDLATTSRGSLDIPYSVLLYAAWALVVSRTTNAKDVLFGIQDLDQLERNAITYRSPAEAVPMRVDLEKATTTRAYLDLVNNAASESVRFSNHYPAWLKRVSSTLQQQYKFRTVILIKTAENLSDLDPEITENLHGNVYESPALVLNVLYHQDRVVLKVQFDSSVIQRWDVENLLNRLDSTIRALESSALDDLISEISVATSHDLQKIWHQNQSTYAPIDCFIHHAIEEFAQKQPSSPAVCAWDGALTYLELEKSSRNLASRLIDRGVTPGTIVPICFEKSMMTPIIMLAVLKAGGAFLLLDASLPEQRLRQILSQAEANFVICSFANREVISNITGDAMVITKDALAQINSLEGEPRSCLPTDFNSPAYVIFTSGSTGVPKGVSISHKNVASAFLRNEKLFGCDKDSRIYDFASYNFTVSLTNFFMALTQGGCLCVPSEQDRRTDFPGSFEALNSNTVITTPSAIASLSPSDFSGLRLLIFGGEKVSAKDIAPWQNHVTTVIAYANSESTTCVVTCPGEDCINHPGVIGKGLAAVTWVVDPENHDYLLPNGCIGELLIESPLVGRGYVNDAIKTAAVFIEDPIWLINGVNGHPGRHGRLYKTGDLVCKDQAGRLNYVSRKDAQVKIRGQRIELGDVEHCVQDCLSDTVSNVVVDVIQTDTEKAKSTLVAFLLRRDDIAQKGGRTSSPTEVIPIPGLVEDHLLERLPSYMIPVLFIYIAALPTTGTGKINRKALRQAGELLCLQSFGSTLWNTADRTVRSMNGTEQKLADIWAEVLNINRSTIGPEQSFLALGGDSISAVEVVAAGRELGFGLSVVDVLRYSKLHRVAERVFELDTLPSKDPPPFALLTHEGTETSRKADISFHCQLDTDMIADAYPCTPLQEGLISLESIRPGDYITQIIVDLGPEISVPRFRAAWDRLYEQLGILRTRIVHHPKNGLLQVEMKDTIDWTVTHGLDSYLKKDKLKPMGLGQPLTRYAIVGDDVRKDHWFVWTSHHALYDAWSMSLIVKALSSFYSGGVIHRGPSFRNFIQHRLGSDQATTMSYWRHALSGYNSVQFPNLPASVVETTANDYLDYKIIKPRQITSNVTVSTLIRAAWAVVVSQVANSKDVVFGTTMSGRNTEILDIDKIIGPTIATVPVRIKFTSGQTVTSFLRQVQQQSMDMIPHEHFGLQNIAKLSQDCQRGIQFQTLLVVQPQNEKEISSDLGTWRLVAEPHWLNTYALTLSFHLDQQFIQAKASFDSTVIQSQLVKKMLQRVNTVLQQLSQSGKGETVEELRIITDEEMDTIWSWNENVPLSTNECVHTLFTQIAQSQRDSPAICSWDGELTFGELDMLSTRLAGYLQNRGVKVEEIVPVCFEKSMWTVVAMMGILKAGGAFTPLDPNHPTHRHREIITQTNANIVLTSPQYASLWNDAGLVVIEVNSTAFSEIPEGLGPKSHQVAPENIMYVLFTSGSTGIPKGVVLEHASVSTSCLTHGKMFAVTPRTRFLQVTAYTADISITEIFTTLLHGGCVCVLSDHDKHNDLSGAIARLGATWAYLTPTMARLLDPATVPSLEKLLLGGEPVTTEECQKWSGKLELVNTYGPTECAVLCSAYFGLEGFHSGLIGKAISSVMWIVDQDNHHRLVPIGSVGEIVIEGPIVGRGYLDDPVKSEQAFIRDPAWLVQGSGKYTGREGRILYKTGDLAYYKPNGDLVCVGRKDGQIKIRGQRVELGEVEHHVHRLIPQAHQIAVEVLTLPGDGDRKTLTAFLGMSANSDQIALVPRLRDERITESELTNLLPEHMVPRIYVSLPTIPLTASGKTDRKQLRSIGELLAADQIHAMRTLDSHHDRPPSTAKQISLQKLWAKVLGLESENIFLDNSFFQLGGDSIDAMKLVSDARREGIEFTVADVFRNHKLESLADKASMNEGLIHRACDNIVPFSLLGISADVAHTTQSAAASCQVEVTAIEDIYPCSPLQEGLYALSFKKPGDYVMQSIMELSPEVNESAFRSAWEKVVDLNGVLRTRIIQDSKFGLVQTVISENLRWDSVESLDSYLASTKSSLVSLGAPISRYALVRDVDSNKRLFVWTVHHALYDAWTLSRITDQVRSIYHSHTLQKHPPFQTFVKYLQGQDMVATTQFWQKQFKGCQAIPFPSPPSDVREISAEAILEYQSSALPQLPEDITIATLIHGAWAIVVGCHTNKDDVVFGVTVSGRNAPVPDIDMIVGPTIATVPVRAQLAPTTKISEFLQGLRNNSIDSIQYEQTGLQRIAQMGQDTKNACKFQTLLVVEPEISEETRRLGTWQIKSDMQDFASYPLVLQFAPDHQEIHVTANFDETVVGRDTVKTMVSQCLFVMEQLSDNYCQAKIEDVDLLTVEDRDQLWEWNHTMPPTVNKCVHEVFNEQVRLRIDAPAISAWDGRMAYSELDEISSRFSTELISMGLKTGDIVPLCFEKSKWAVVAMIAVLKAGGTFTSLDPDHPPSRHKDILDQTGASFVFTSAQCSLLWKDSDYHVSIVSEETIPRPRDRAEPTDIHPGTAAYIIFTSGSTGTPKGVILEHQAVVTSCLGHGKVLGFNSQTRALQFSSYTFDACISEIITTLLHGGCVCVPCEADRRNHVGDFINRNSVNWVFLTPAIVQLLDPETVPTVKILAVGGEVVNPKMWTAWRGRQVKAINVYGPTECCIYCTAHHGIDDFHSGLIGKSIASVSWIVDPEDPQRLAPFGSVGELLIEGPILARGYLDHSKTDAAFIKDPAWLLHGSKSYPGRNGRLYKTGDLAYYKPDGSIVCIGRKDSQVKIRGQRVELGDIEYHIKECMPQVEQVAAEVIMPIEGKGSTAVAAFVQADEETHTLLLSAGYATGSNDPRAHIVFPPEVHEKLTERLPQYMVPSIWVLVQRIPITTSGKTDRKELRKILASFTTDQLAEIRTSAQSQKRHPRTQNEITMRRLWAQVLDIQSSNVGLDDSFLQLGGDSVSAMKLVAVARDEGIHITVADIFRNSKLVQLADVGRSQMHYTTKDATPFSLLVKNLDRYQLCQDISARCATNPESIEDVYPCSPLQEGMIYLTLKRPRNYVVNLVLQLHDTVDVTKFQAAWQQVVQANPILRTMFVQHSTLGLLQAVSTESLQWAKPDNLKSYLAEQDINPFGLNALMARYAIIREPGSSRPYFVWTLHHALYDGWSLPYMIDEVRSAYRGRQLKINPRFSNFIRYIRALDQDAAAKYWNSSLSSCQATPFPPLPPKLLQPIADSFLTRTCLSIPVLDSDTTYSTYIRAAWAIVSSYYTHSDDITFGATMSGRSAPVHGIESMVGPTIATVPVRIRVLKQQSVARFLQEIQDQGTGMIPYEQTGLQQIRKAGPGASVACDFQTLLVIQQTKEYLSDNSTFGEWQSNLEQQNFTTFGLALQFIPTSKDLKIMAAFDSRVIKTWQTERILSQLDFVVHQLAAAGTSTTLGDIDIVTPEDMEEIWTQNSTVPQAIERCVHDLFSEQARAHPTSPAISGWDGGSTYEELDEMSNELADYLVDKGINSEDLIPLCFEKSMWTVVAMLGVLKAGGAFVPLDPDHPRSRKQGILEKINAKLILCSDQHLRDWEDSSWNCTAVSRSSYHQLRNGEKRVPSLVSPRNTAYAMFTSGSTGLPKGVILEHQAVSTSCIAHGKSLQFSSKTRALQFSAYTFDVCIAEIFTTLLHGGCICIPSESQRRDDLTMTINALKVNWVSLTPSVARTLDADKLLLEHIALGGEKVSEEDWGLFSHIAKRSITYGPTECCVYCTWAPHSRDFSSGMIGKSVGSLSWVVDPEDHQKLAPIGSIGELLVEGPILARGYLEDEEKTRAAFVQDPSWLVRGCGTRPGRSGRMYKTGDLVRYSSTGDLIYVGRKDGQVKIRGQRVELGELEHHVREEIPEAKQIAVEIINPDGDQNHKVLAGFLKLEDDFADKLSSTNDAVEATGLEARVVFPNHAIERLRDQLPGYMLPQVYLSIPKLPFTTSGKIDRVRLRELGATLSTHQLARLQTSAEKRPPVTDKEKRLQKLWAQTLSIKPEDIGLDDSFFRLGGDSIAAMKLVGKARQENLSLTVAKLFEHPKLVDLAAVDEKPVTEISKKLLPFSLLSIEEKDIGRLLEDVATNCNVDSKSIEDIYPCSPLQEGLVSLALRNPGDYIMRGVLRLHNNVDLAKFQSAWELIVHSMPILRTRIIQHTSYGLLQAVIKETCRWTLSDDLDGCISKEKSTAMALGDQFSRYGLVRQPNEDQAYFVWSIHHALYDGWSMSKILESVRNVYKGATIEKLPNFSVFLEYLNHQDENNARMYWENALADCQAIIFPQSPLGKAPVASAMVEYRCSSLPRMRHENTTASTLIRAAWAFITSAYTSSDDVVFGCTITGRNASIPRIEDMVGPTIATVPVRIRVHRDASIFTFLETVQQQSTGMIPYEQTGLQRISKLASYTQLACSFQTLLVVQPGGNSFEDEEVLGQWESHSALQDFTTYGLTVQCAVSANGIHVTSSFDPDMISPWNVRRMLGQLDSVIQQMSRAKNGARLSHIDTLSPQDRTDLGQWSKSMPTAVDRCLHDIFGEQAKAKAHAPALCAWDGALNYGQLDNLSTRLAGYLQHILDIKPDGVVPMCFEKSMWTTVAMLGILKAGGAFLLLDPTLPVERLKLITRRVSSTAILTSRASLSVTEKISTKTIVVDDSLMSKITQYSAFKRVASPAHLAYVIFTSGSTGEPKGCGIEHRSTCTAVMSHGPLMGVNGSTRTLQFGSYSFAGSLVETLPTLLLGGCVCIPAEEARMTGLSSAMEKMGVNWAFLTSTVLDLIQSHTVPSLKTLCIGGEQIRTSQVKEWSKFVHLRQTYGSSETSGVISSQRLTKVSTVRDVGKANTGIYWIIDPTDTNRLAPVGAIGEVLVEGYIVGRGYLGDKERTAAVFLEIPSWRKDFACQTPGTQFYKTGDLARYKSDGSIELWGRKDSQIKLRGQRIELGEIEHQARLSGLTSEEIAVELISLQGTEAITLVCFVTPGNSANGEMVHFDGSLLSNSQLKHAVEKIQRRLEQNLPQFMIPTVFIPIPCLPKTPSRKTDRRKLREIGASLSGDQLGRLRTMGNSHKAQPTTEMEDKIRKLWARTLNLEPSQIGIDDSFFRLGGDSITAMQLSSMARSVQIRITTSDIFRMKNISQLASHVVSSSSIEDVASSQTHLDTPFGLTPIQHLYLERLDRTGKAIFDQCFFLRINIPVHFESIKASFMSVVERHPMLRARFSRGTEGRWHQYISGNCADSFEIIQHQSGSDAGIIECLTQSRRDLNIETGPIMKAVLCEDDEDQALFVTIHHLVIDLVSWRIILEELECVLLGNDLPRTTSASFQSWRALQAEHAFKMKKASEIALERGHSSDLSYWGMQSCAITQKNAISHSFKLDNKATSDLFGVCNDTLQTKPLELMIATLIHSFSSVFSDRGAPTIFNETHGREPWNDSLDLSRTVGWFTSILPVTPSRHVNESIFETVRRTKDYMRSFSHNGWLYFASLFTDETSASEFTSLFPVEVMFNYLGKYQQLERADSLFSRKPIPVGCEETLATDSLRFSLFAISLIVEKGCATVTFEFDSRMKHQSRIIRWVQKFEEALNDLPVVLLGRDPEWTLSDCSLSMKSYEDLDNFRTATLSGLSLSLEDIEDLFPCSPMQEGILMSQSRDSSMYWVRIIFEVIPTPKSNVDPDKLHTAWNAVVKKHSLLRSLIVRDIPGTPGISNLILKDPEPTVSRIQGLKKGLATESFEGHLKQHCLKSSDLPHHLCIGECEDGGVFVCFDISHAIIDAHSQMIILRDLQSAYDGNMESLPQAAQFKDVISYHHENVEEESYRYWSEYLQGTEPCHFPTLTEGRNDTHRSGKARVPAIDAEAMHAFCQLWDITPSTVIQTAWALVMKSYTGLDTVCFGSLSSGRDLPIDDVENIYGPLITMIACKLHLNAGFRVLESLKTLQNDYLNSLAYRDFPLRRIHKMLHLKTDALFNSAVSIQRVSQKYVADGSSISFRAERSDDFTEVRKYAVELSRVGLMCG